MEERKEPSRWTKLRRKKKRKIKHCSKFDCQHVAGEGSSSGHESALKVPSRAGPSSETEEHHHIPHCSPTSEAEEGSSDGNYTDETDADCSIERLDVVHESSHSTEDTDTDIFFERKDTACDAETDAPISMDSTVSDLNDTVNPCIDYDDNAPVNSNYCVELGGIQNAALAVKDCSVDGSVPCDAVMSENDNAVKSKIAQITGRTSDDEEFLLSDDDSDCGDLQMRFLEAEPIVIHNPEDDGDEEFEEGPHGDGQQPAVNVVEAPEGNLGHPAADNEEAIFPAGDESDDPDDPDDADDSSGSDSSSESSDGDNFNFENNTLNTPLRCANGRTVREALLMNLASSIRHNWTYEALLDVFRCMNTLLVGQPLPQSKTKLWSIVNRNGAGLTVYAYCNRCSRLLGKKAALPVQGNVVCPCGFETTVQHVKWFVSLSLRKQLEHFLSFPGIAALLEYPETRQKKHADGIEDIFDGERYKQLQREGKIIPGDRTFTYVFNTDGFRTAKQGKVSAWGLLVRLNELPPSLRQKYMFLAGIWVDTKEPHMNTFLRPFVAQANRLSTTGVLWKPDGINEVRSKFIPLCMCVDAKARFPLLNMTQYNGTYGCTFCTHQGVQIDGSRYPVLPHEDLPPAELRTHASIVEAMLGGVPFQGQKGPSELLMLNSFDLGDGGNALDDLHPLYSGVTKFHTNLILENVNNETLDLIDRRLLRIKSHTSIARKPTSVKGRGQWKGTDWRNWILYYAIPCLTDLVPQYHVLHLQLLSRAAFILSLDSILPADLEVARDFLLRYITLFQQNHGVENMRYNVHVLGHCPRSVRNFGPLWTTSTFNFESWNLNIRNTITSPKGVIDQIVSRHLMRLHVYVALESDIISERVKAQMSSVLSKSKRRVMAQNVGNNVYVLGTPTVRQPTQEENGLIEDAQVICAGDLSVYDRVISDGTEYRCLRYHPDTRSNNSFIYTDDDWFGTIIDIVTFRDQNGDTICGAFVEQHDVETPFEHATHFAEIVRESTLTFILISKIRSPAIQITVRNHSYIVPMANNFGID